VIKVNLITNLIKQVVNKVYSHVQGGEGE